MLPILRTRVLMIERSRRPTVLKCLTPVTVILKLVTACPILKWPNPILDAARIRTPGIETVPVEHLAMVPINLLPSRGRPLDPEVTGARGRLRVAIDGLAALLESTLGRKLNNATRFGLLFPLPPRVVTKPPIHLRQTLSRAPGPSILVKDPMLDVATVKLSRESRLLLMVVETLMDLDGLIAAPLRLWQWKTLSPPTLLISLSQRLRVMTLRELKLLPFARLLNGSSNLWLTARTVRTLSPVVPSGTTANRPPIL